MLLDSVYACTFAVLNRLHQEDVTLDIVAIGDETTWGFLDESETTDGWTWPGDAEKFNTALSAVDDFNNTLGTEIRKAVHFTDAAAEWLAGLFQQEGISSFDMIGLSFYPQWTELNSLEGLGGLVAQLIDTYGKDVMVFETATPWTSELSDDYNNILSGFGNLDYPVSTDGQRQFLLDLAAEVHLCGGGLASYTGSRPGSLRTCATAGAGDQPGRMPASSILKMGTHPCLYLTFLTPAILSLLRVQKTGSPQVILYPNPVEDALLYLRSAAPLIGWEFHSADGKFIRDGNMDNGDHNIPVSNLDSGIYLLKLTDSSGNTMLEKVLIE